MNQHVVAGAKTSRALDLIKQARGFLASAFQEISVVKGVAEDLKAIAAAEAAVERVWAKLERKRPRELLHEISPYCGCGCWQLAELTMEHTPTCPAFDKAWHPDYDPEMCDPEICEPGRARCSALAPRKAVAS